MQFTTNDMDQDSWEGNYAMNRMLTYLWLDYNGMQYTTYNKDQDSWER